MTLVSLCFEVHQPLRLKKNFFWDGFPLKQVVPNLGEFYFDDHENKRIFERISDKCYLPANEVILESIKKHEGSDRPFQVAYSFSGIFLEQCCAFRPEVLDSFVRLVETGQVEVMEQTYYHSLASLYEDKSEFLEQVKMHKELIWDIFGLHPTTFENTELIYNDEIARMVESMGYKAVFTEGVVENPNYVYRPPKTEISLLLRNYKLTDDIGFRFSSHSWEEYPLTADKYAGWLAATPGQCINIFCDYETFGEHQWTDTGIFEFLCHLPGEVLRHENLRFATPSEIARDIAPERELSVPNYVSWADLERDTSCWLGNALQQACFIYQKRLEAPVKESGDQELLRIWRTFGLSDHLYYIFTHGGGPGEVHSYFSPYGISYDASVTYFSVLCDLHYRLKKKIHLADSPFRFATGKDQFTGEVAWSLAGLQNILKAVSIDSLQYHNSRGDLARWAASSLADTGLAERMSKSKSIKGERLRKSLLSAVDFALSEDK
ncbi:MAG: glycoside hydrolase family 57 protein [Methanotrichaceae archaeon]|nr:glycoside hydrolase family 57 protein [Methanotrichaceae archaeon]